MGVGWEWSLPFAGMTRIRFDGSRGSPASQPLTRGSPRSLDVRPEGRRGKGHSLRTLWRYSASRLTQMLRKLIGGMGSPCACSLIGEGPWAL